MTWQDVLTGPAKWSCEQADCLPWLASLPAGSLDLVFGSPPYTDARTYSRTDVSRGCQEWVDWMLAVTTAAVRVSKGLVLWVVAGVQRDKCYWPACEGLAWEWWKRGNQLWRPCIWWKVNEDEGGTGIPGSGGKQWLRNDWEYVLAFKKEGWLPWADPLVMGHAPICDQVGGEMSNRRVGGTRVNLDGSDPLGKHGRGNGLGGRRADGTKKTRTQRKRLMDVTAGNNADGTLKANGSRPMPKVANPGNVLPHLPDDELVGGIVKARVGGGHMGSKLCHEGEAPFPEKLAEFFVRSFCPGGGIVADCFSGTGTTLAAALKWGRRFVGCDLRQSQVDLTARRAGEVGDGMFE